MMSDTNLIWLDLEMTGLDPETDVIIEVASIVTDAELNVLAEGPNLAVHVSDERLEAMDDWCKRTHGKSGLIDRIRASTVSIEEADQATLAFVQQWVPKGQSPLCGNSISHDRRFVRREMPLLQSWLHYRHIDVSTLKELARRWYPNLPAHPKNAAHLALDDIRESISELKYFREHLFVANPGPTEP